MIKVLHEVGGQPVVAWVTEREYGIPDVCSKNMPLAKLIVTSVRIHAWAIVSLGGVVLRTPMALMPGVFVVPGIPSTKTILPFRHPDMDYLSVQKDMGESISIVLDPENDNIHDLNRKFLRPGLWFSADFANGTIIGSGQNLYLVPETQVDGLGEALKIRGANALEGFPSFPDPTVSVTDAHGIIVEGPQRTAKAGCFIATAALGSEAAPEVAVLRRYRDTVLRETAVGRGFIRAYEATSPPLARLIARSRLAKLLVRALIVRPAGALAGRSLSPGAPKSRGGRGKVDHERRL